MLTRKIRHFKQDEAGDGADLGGAPAGDPAAAPAAAPAAGDWKAGLAPEFTSNPAFADIKDINGLAKSYLSAQQMIGADKLVIPRETDGADKWNEFYNKVGRPEAADKYQLTMPEANDKFPADPAMVEKFRSIFHDAGLTNKQADKIFTEYNAYALNALQTGASAQETQMQQWADTIQAEWKNDFEANAAIAHNAVLAFGDEDTAKFLTESGLGNHPGLVKMFLNIGKAIGEDKALGDRSMSTGFATGDQAKMEITKLQGDSEFMKQYMNADHPQHRQAAERMQNLYNKAYPGKVTE